MSAWRHLLAIVAVFGLASLGWIILGGVTSSRTSEQRKALDGRAADLWGSSQTQQAPSFELRWSEVVSKTEQITDEQGRTKTHATSESSFARKASTRCEHVSMSISTSINAGKGCFGFRSMT